MEEHSDQPSVEESREIQMEAGRDESPPPQVNVHVYNVAPHYSEQKVENLGEMLSNRETFEEALEILISWVQRGECNETNYTSFFSLFQLCWDYADKLQAEEKVYMEEIKRTDQQLLNRKCQIQLHLMEIEEIFNIIDTHNIWSSFTPHQAEKMQEMRKEILALKKRFLEDFSDVTVGIESNDMNIEGGGLQNDILKMRTKIGSLTYKLNNAYKKTEEMKAKREEYVSELRQLREEFEMRRRQLKEKTNVMIDGDNQPKNLVDAASQFNSDLEMHMVSLISVFLFNHPDGKNTDCIYSFLSKHIPVTQVIDVENLLKRHPQIFKESMPIEATQEKKWICISLDQKTLAELLKELK